jgi:hypothetical protein
MSLRCRKGDMAFILRGMHARDPAGLRYGERDLNLLPIRPNALQEVEESQKELSE